MDNFFESLVLGLVARFLPALSQYFLIADALYHTLSGHPDPLAAPLQADISIKGKAYAISLTPK